MARSPSMQPLEVCKLDRSQQAEELARFLARKSNNQLHVEQLGADLSGFFAKLQQFEATKPGSVEVRSGTGKTTVIIVGKDHRKVLQCRTKALMKQYRIFPPGISGPGLRSVHV